MSYELITQYDSRNFTPAASVPATYGRQRTIDSITIHWWGLPEWNATFEGTTTFLCTNNKPTSAHEVIEAGRVAVIVNHGDASWAAGNAVGNATSIHLELNPRASDADYATAAERIRDIRALHGKDLPLIPHRTWQATMCPGNYDLDRLDRIARGSTITTQGSTSEEDDMAVSPSFEPQVREALALIVDAVDGFPIFDQNVRAVFDVIRSQNEAQTATISQLVTMLAERESLDAETIITGVTDAIAARVKITATVEEVK